MGIRLRVLVSRGRRWRGNIKSKGIKKASRGDRRGRRGDRMGRRGRRKVNSKYRGRGTGCRCRCR